MPVEGRTVHDGDTLVVDFVSEGEEESRDQVVELGAGKLTRELEQGLVGAEIGESREIPFFLTDGSTSSVKLRFGASTGFPTTNGFTLPASGVILLSVASEKGFAWAS